MLSLISTAIFLGIPKKQLLNDFYLDEIPYIISRLIKLKFPTFNEGDTELVDVENFFE